ncbi:MAG: universal stress protein, partial [bacterium]|nr:universal stress protein [bacterium]
MKKILFPTDFSEASINAFIYALKLADSIKGEIITLHVYDLPQVGYSNVPGVLNEIYDLIELGSFENYKDQVPFLRRIAEQNNMEHIKISNVLDTGNLINRIIKIVEDEAIDYVVMGTKGATSLTETFLGTATTKVMNATSAIVFAIP